MGAIFQFPNVKSSSSTNTEHFQFIPKEILQLLLFCFGVRGEFNG